METETDTEREVLETKTDRQRQREVLGVFLEVLEGQEQEGEGWGRWGEGGRAGKGGGGGVGEGWGVKSVDNSSRTARVARKGCWVNCFVTVTVVRTRRDSAPVN